ncbi:hypothetical protein ABT301_00780 [Streptomyces sp. NPDC000987]|uniref:hypothetical protein n=1 Tax=Streptomyces sp. NPDC000987 TaxID=3154374 RepID=UPI0033168277
MVAVIGGAGYYVWHKHRTDNQVKKSSSQSTGTGQKNDSGTKTPTNPYAGWETYTDSLHGYSFRYPSDWKLNPAMVPTQVGDAGDVQLTSPDGAVVVSYINANNRDHDYSDQTTVSVDKLDLTNQRLSIVGGYITYGTGYLPLYNTADSSVIASYPVSVGAVSKFPTTAWFTNQKDSSLASFIAQPAQQEDATAAATNWFTTPNAKVALQILKSLTY